MSLCPRLASCALLLALCALPAGSQGTGDPQGAGAKAPLRLVVLVAVDQMIPEQLERLAPLLSGGLGRFARSGSLFTEARLQYAVTETGPGHATFGTGMNPLHHGIIANDWTLPEEKAPSYCVGDPDARLLTASGPTSKASMSPRNLRAAGLIDRLKALDPASKGFSVSAKDRAAIGMSGQHPELALWWDRVDGGFVSSSWYAPTLPAWVVAFDVAWMDAFRRDWGGGWKPLDVGSFAGTDTAADDAPGEVPWKGSHVFPYPAPDLPAAPDPRERAEIAAVVYGSPAADQFACELARIALVEMDLGSDEHADVLCLSLSACDSVGHAFGPRSREVTDVLLRADRQLELLFADIDRRVGAGRWIAALTADHGVMDLPEALVQRGVGAERLSGKLLSSAIKHMRRKLEEKYGEDFFLMYDGHGVRLSATRILAAGHKPADVRKFAAADLQEECAAWLERAWTLDELQAVARGGEAALGWKRSWANSFDEERTPDIALQLKPWKLLAMDAGTTHGSTYPYDQRVPLAFLGPAFAARRIFGPASSVDALPTLMAAMGLALPKDLDGRDLFAR